MLLIFFTHNKLIEAQYLSIDRYQIDNSGGNLFNNTTGGGTVSITNSNLTDAQNATKETETPFNLLQRTFYTGV